MRFEDREQAYANVIELLGEDYASVITPEQLNETYRINLIDQTQSDVIIEAFRACRASRRSRTSCSTSSRFLALTVATYIAVGIAALMLVAAVLLIATTIRLSAYARRRELGIMRLVGASNRFIQTPFILEGVFAALLGSLLAERRCSPACTSASTSTCAAGRLRDDLGEVTRRGPWCRS